MAAPVNILPEVASGVASLGNTLLSNFLGRSNMDKQVQQAKELMDYQWTHYQSPLAQVSAYGAAGINPAIMFGNPQGQFATPSVNQPTPSYAPVDMLRGMDGFANYIRAVAEAKKAGVETRNLEKDLELKQVDQETKEFALSLQKLYGNRQKVLELSLLRRNIVLAIDNHDINEYDKLIKEWESKTASIVNEAEGFKKGILKKQFDNEDQRLRLSNRLLESQGTAAFASAEASLASAERDVALAEQTKLFNKIYSDQRFKHSIITQALEAGRQAVEQSKLTKSQAEHMNYMVQQAAYATDMQEFTYWSNQIQSFVHSVGEGVSSFYGAGALRELIKLRQVQNMPPVSINGFHP